MSFDITTLATKYGAWVLLLVYFLYQQVWPLLANKIIPAKLHMEEKEKEFLQSMEIQRNMTLKQIADAVQSMAVSNVATNERIATILSNQMRILTKQDTTQNTLTEAVADMRAVTGVASGDRNRRSSDSPSV